MKTRIISAVILFSVTTLCFAIPGPVSKVLYFLIVGIICAYELSKNFEKLDAACSLWVMVAYLSVSAVLILFNAKTYYLVVCFVCAVFLSQFAGILQEKVSGKGAFYTMGGVCYPCMLFVSAMAICKSDFWVEAILLGTFPSFLSDIFALFGGSRFGKHKLAPLVSPNKTIEGSVCGAIAGTITGLIIFYVFQATGISDLSAAACTVIALAASGMGQIGDLAESLLKRLMGVKDFSNLIPGHGGFFDRADALLFSIPTAYFLIKLTHQLIM